MKERVYHTAASFKELVRTLTNGEYEVRNNYVKSSIKVRILHHTCNQEYEVTPNHFLKGKRCPHCWKVRRVEVARVAQSGKWNTARLKEEVKKAVGDEYTVLGKYISSLKPVRIRHNSERCGFHEYTVRSVDFLKKDANRCPACAAIDRDERIRSMNPKKTTAQFRREVRDRFEGKYEVVGKYVNNKTKILMRHVECGQTYEMTPNDVLTGYRCPACFRKLPKESEPARRIKHMLENGGYGFETEVMFEGCRHKRLLKFDFCVYKDDTKEDYFLIEYNGRQHYAPTLKTDDGNDHRLEEQMVRDRIKVEFCAKHGIELHIIRYDEDVEERMVDILEKEPHSTSRV